MNSDIDDRLFARLLFDLMIPAQFAEAISLQGYDIVEARTLPVEIQQDDRALLEEAARAGRVLVTCNYSDPNSNFNLIHEERMSKGKQHAGIIFIYQYQISNRIGRWEVRDRLLSFLNQHTADELRNQIWWLSSI